MNPWKEIDAALKKAVDDAAGLSDAERRQIADSELAAMEEEMAESMRSVPKDLLVKTPLLIGTLAKKGVPAKRILSSMTGSEGMAQRILQSFSLACMKEMHSRFTEHERN